MDKMKYILIIIVLAMCIVKNEASSWDNDKTHLDLARYAAELSILKGDYLTNLGFSKGLLETLAWDGTSNRTIDWIREGGKREDGNNREVNHFFNPLVETWTNAGLWGIWRPAVLWSQDSDRQSTWPYGSNATPSNEVIQSLGYTSLSSNFPFEALSDWSWQTTRGYYYLACTSTSTTVREANFAKMFRGLGQQMHLLQDMSVPMHVRNDSHLFNRWIEEWVA